MVLGTLERPLVVLLGPWRGPWDPWNVLGDPSELPGRPLGDPWGPLGSLGWSLVVPRRCHGVHWDILGWPLESQGRPREPLERPWDLPVSPWSPLGSP